MRLVEEKIHQTVSVELLYEFDKCMNERERALVMILRCYGASEIVDAILSFSLTPNT